MNLSLRQLGLTHPGGIAVNVRVGSLGVLTINGSMNDLVIYAADIGSVKGGNFGWSRRSATSPDASSGHGGHHPADLVAEMTEDFERGRSIALGLECPLWMDLPTDAAELTRGRDGEGSRPWSAGAGSGALATGLVQTAWILRELRAAAPKAKAFLRWPEFVEAKSGLYLWEAFVTGAAKTVTHVGDAQKAADAFAAALPDPSAKSSVRSRGGEVVSLIGAALLRTGWTTDVALLSQSCLVIRANQ